jgi:nucleotide-binding universal stress UspA family protein
MKTLTIKRIMIPVDFSETSMMALEHGANMAKLFNAELYLIHVVELFEYTFNIYEPLVNIDTMEMETMVNSNLDEQITRIRKQYGVHVFPVLARGRVSSEISEAAIDNKIDLIIMGTHGAKGFSEYFIGTNSHRTVTLSPCPVITVQTPAKAEGFKRIVMPIDETLHSRQKVDTVIYLAEKYKSTVHVLGLINVEDETDEAKFAIKLETVEKALKRSGIPFEKKVVHGKNLAIESMNYATEINADLIAIMTDHESNLTGMFLGGFAKQIVNHSKTPILSIRPMEGPVDYSFGGGGYV